MKQVLFSIFCLGMFGFSAYGRTVHLERGESVRVGSTTVKCEQRGGSSGSVGTCNSYGCSECGTCNAFGCPRCDSGHAGGSCNSYGCWDGAAGECNAFGCSNNGKCNSYGCSENGECNAWGCP